MMGLMRLGLISILTFLSCSILNTVTAFPKAVVVAGSNEWDNYRHQADAFHAYQELVRNGMHPDDITLFAYNDIAYNELNPTPGVVINRPHGRNVFPGNDSIDFSGDDVTPANFLSVLNNLSHSDLELVVYFTDHGGPGILCFPNEYLHVGDFRDAFLKMKYKSLLFIVEACEAGSMFDVWFPKNASALAITATDPYLPSWACYDDIKVQNYLGDCFSVNVLQFLGPADTYIETVGLMAKVVTNQTTQSPVQVYGDLRVLDTPLAKFWGKHLGGATDTKFNGEYYSPNNVRPNPIRSWDVPRAIGLKTLNDKRYDSIRNKDSYHRTLYSKLKYLVRARTIPLGIKLNSYNSPVNSDCIKSCLNTLSAAEIVLSGYSLRFTEVIAAMCDKLPATKAVEIIRQVAKVLIL